MKILITGNQGFIGSNLEKYLIKLNYAVIGLDLKSGNDILDCKLPDCDLVIHLAGVSGVRESCKNPSIYWINNVEGTKRILEHYKNKRVLVASSSSQYEPHLNPYAASKYIIEKIPHNNVVFMRLHTVYGLEPRKGMFFDKLLNNQLTYVTDHLRDFIHIDDVCDAIHLLIIKNIQGSIDIGTGITIKISDLCPTISVAKDVKHERTETCADISILKSLGFSPKNNVFDFINKIRR